VSVGGWGSDKTKIILPILAIAATMFASIASTFDPDASYTG
jgi:hypothetical protein